MSTRMKKALSLVLTLAMVIAMLPAITVVFNEKAHAYGTYSKNYSTEYYYASGTTFIKALCVGWDSSSTNTVRSQMSGASWTPTPTNLDMMQSWSGTKHIAVGYRTTTDPTQALNGIKFFDSDDAHTNYSWDGKNSGWNGDHGGTDSNGYKYVQDSANTSIHYYRAGEAPFDAYSVDGVVDFLMKMGSGYGCVYLCQTRDRAAGAPITAVDCMSSTSANGYTAVGCVENGCTYHSSAHTHSSRYVGVKRLTTTVDSAALRSNYTTALGRYNESNYSAKYTSASRTALQNALTTAEGILSDLNDGYTTSSQTAIDSAAAALSNAVSGLTLNTYTVTFKGYTSGTTVGTLKTQTVSYGGNATAPSVSTTYDGTNHYTFKSWSGSYTNVTAAQTVTATYNTVAHSYTSQVTNNATCTAPGSTKYTCTCGYSYTSNTVPAALNHDFSSQTTTTAYLKSAATCTAKAVYYYKCSRCSEKGTATYEYGSTLGHSYTGDYVNQGSGKHYRKCVRFDACGTYGIGTTQNATESCSGGAATCTAAAVCSRCNTAYGSALNHSWNYAGARFNWNGYACATASVHCSRCDSGTLNLSTTVTSDITTDPTCTAEGVRTYTASFTQGGTAYTSQKTEPVAAAGHSAAKIAAKAATCLAVGNNEYWYCSQCEKYFTTEACTAETTVAAQTIAKKEHSYTGAIRSDGNGETGTHSFLCVNGCSQYGGTVAHTWNDGIVTAEPTCTADGVRTFTCTASGCGATYTAPEATPGHDYQFTETVAPTCTEDGYDLYTCSRCPATEQRNPVAAPGHDWEWIVDTAATCGASGVKHEACKNCDAVRNENTAIDATGEHEFEWVIDTEPTCGTSGIKHEKCKNCDAVRNENTAIEPTGAHEFEWVIDTAATCGTTGLKHEKCKNCDAVQNENTEIEATGAHNYSAATVNEEALQTPANCTNAAVYYYSCSVCGVVEFNNAHTFTDGDANGHVWEWIVDTEPTCGTAGLKHEKCKNCDAVQSENTAIEPTGDHEFEWVVDTEPTCGASGLKHEACKNCDTVRNENTAIDATGEHEFEWVVDTEPTCGVAGVKHEACKNCDAVRSENTAIDATGEHEFEWVVDTAPTCGAAGVKHEECKNCDAVRSENTAIDPTGEHEFEWMIDMAATCGTSGVKHEECKHCDAVRSENTAIVPTGEHEFEWVIDTPATCGAAGVKHEKCKNCDAVQSENTAIVPTGEHEYEWVIDMAPTCGTSGVKHEKCKNCDAVRSENTAIVPTGEHEFEWVVDTAATCGTSGVKHEKCKNCDAVRSENTAIDATGEHDFEWVIDTEPTCGTTGVKHEECKNCDAVRSENTAIVPTGEHEFEWVIDTAATCGAAGLKHEKCKNCDAVQSENTAIEPTAAHDFTVQDPTDAYLNEAATCSAKATYFYACSVCGAKGTETYETGGYASHDLHHVEAAEAGCPNHAAMHAPRRSGSPVAVTGYNGNIEYWYCENCGRYFADADAQEEVTAAEIIIPAAHHMRHTPAVPAGCEEGVVEYWYCEICGSYYLTETAETPLTEEAFEEVKTLPAVHNAAAPVVENDHPATCTEAGSYDSVTYCADCGEELSRETVTVPAGHRWGEWEVVTPATEDTDGEAKRVCSVCGAEETKPLSAMGEEITKTIQFVNIAKMHYVLDLGDGETYTVYNSSAVQWISRQALRFKVVTYAGYNYDDIIIRANGVEIEPDADGYYSLPQTAETVVVTAEGAVKDDSAPNGRLSFWELLVRFFRKIVAFFTSAFGKES